MCKYTFGTLMQHIKMSKRELKICMKIWRVAALNSPRMGRKHAGKKNVISFFAFLFRALFWALPPWICHDSGATPAYVSPAKDGPALHWELVEKNKAWTLRWHRQTRIIHSFRFAISLFLFMRRPGLLRSEE